MNIYHAVDNLLADWVSPKARRTIHTALIIASLIVTAVMTAERDWVEAGVALLTAFYSAANRANTPALPSEEDSHPDEGRSYEDLGGIEYPSA